MKETLLKTHENKEIKWKKPLEKFKEDSYERKANKTTYTQQRSPKKKTNTGIQNILEFKKPL